LSERGCSDGGDESGVVRFRHVAGGGRHEEEKTKKLGASTALLCTVLHGSDIDALTP